MKRSRLPPMRLLVRASMMLGLTATSDLCAQDVNAVQRRSLYEDLQMFSQVLNQIRVNHPDSIDPHELLMAAIEGMVQAADPHSYVIPSIRLTPDRAEAFNKGELVSVPVTFTYLEDVPVVSSVSPGTHAATIDILPGDELLAINAEPVAANSSAELDMLLAGDEGTRVTLTLQRRRFDGTIATVIRTITREESEELSAIVADLMLDEQAGYIRIAHFGNDRVADDFHEALERLKNQGMTRLVLDLRDNSGGLVDEASKITGEFLPRGALVYTADGRKEEVIDTVTVGRSFWRRAERYPIVVMVNGGTASAAELVAGALQDHDRALIVGQPTFGKSLLMQPFPMTDGSIIVLVIGQVRTPCGRIIQRDYRGVSRRDYLRRAGSVADTAGRPTCRTAAGRTVYGGGGVYPDVLLDETEPTPMWLQEIAEKQLVLRWIGGYLADSVRSLMQPDDPGTQWALPSRASQDLMEFAESEGIDVPSDETSIGRLERLVLAHLVWQVGGYAEYYALLARRSSEVRTAVEELERAALLVMN